MVTTLLPDLPAAFRIKVHNLLRAAYTPGTWRNKITQMKVYANFVSKYNLNSLNPSRYQVMSYIAFLKDKYNVPGTVLNYICGAKAWVKFKGGDASPFEDYLVTLMKKGVAKSGQHIVTQAPPLYINDIKRIIKYFNIIGDNACVFKTVTLIAYFSLLRQSNLVMTSWEGASSHVVQMRDIKVDKNKLYVTVRSTKTTWKVSEQFTVCIPSIPMSPCCPVKAWEDYYRLAPKNTDIMAFWSPGGTPLCANKWLGAIRHALSVLGYGNANDFTLHSLRRGAAQTCILKGMKVGDVREAGRWKSEAMYRYIPRQTVKKVPAALTTLFG